MNDTQREAGLRPCPVGLANRCRCLCGTMVLWLVLLLAGVFVLAACLCIGLVKALCALADAMIRRCGP